MCLLCDIHSGENSSVSSSRSSSSRGGGCGVVHLALLTSVESSPPSTCRSI